MPRYHAPRWLRKHAGPRILAELRPTDDLDERVSALRALHPQPAALVLVVGPTSTAFAWAMNHPQVDAAVLGSPDLGELAESWEIDFLVVEDGRGVLQDRRVNRDDD